MPDQLSANLFREIRDPAFFRVLTGRNAATYVDALDALDRENTAKADGIDRHEAVEIIADVLAAHPEFAADDDMPSPAVAAAAAPGQGLSLDLFGEPLAAVAGVAPGAASSRRQAAAAGSRDATGTNASATINSTDIAAPAGAASAAPPLTATGSSATLGAVFASRRDLARRILDYLTRCRWLEEPPRKDWRRRLYFDAHGATLIAALRQIGRPEAVVFTDKLVAVCSMLHNEEQLREQPLQTVEACLDNTRVGIGELRAMQKSVQRLTRAQLDQDTLRGNLSLVFNDYADQVGHGAYAELVRARLPVRLPEAVRRIGERLFNDGAAMAEMTQEMLRRHAGMAADTAVTAVRQRLDELAYLLELVLPMADEIDRRTADFTRRSLARFRYLQDVTGERRGEIASFFEQVNLHFTGKRLSAAWTLPELPSLRLPETRIPAGQESLYTPHTRRAPAEQNAIDDEVTDADSAAGLRDMERALKESLSVRRANAFILSIPGAKGTRITSAQLPIPDERHLTEVIALLLHSESAEAKYRLEPWRLVHEDQEAELDELPGARVERFTLVKG